MTDKPSRVLLVVRAENSEAPALADEIRAWLESRGVEALVANHPGERGGSAGDLPVSGCDLVIVLGGDGTMISVARQVAGRAPMVGLNMGRLGFLSELSPRDWPQFLERVLARACRYSERLVLEYSVSRDGAELRRGLAVNDVVLNRGSLARLIRLDLDLGGEALGSLRADGLVVSTPTGSTAYSISSGGPIVQPELDVFTVTPICPFLHNFRPMVLSGGAVFTARVQDPRSEVFLTVDGQDCLPLEAGDEVRVARSARGLRLLEPERPAWVTRLRDKGLIE
ncbi:NAD(+)/NADH kinase [Desulfocurvus sp. DL9XJH121]